MDKNGQAREVKAVIDMGDTPVTDLPFYESEDLLPGVAVLSTADLLQRAQRHAVNSYAPLRPDFHHLVVVAEGSLAVAVDFDEHTLRPGDVLWARPHQILQYRQDLAATNGTVILFPSGFLDATAVSASAADRPATTGLVVRSAAAISAIEYLAQDYRHPSVQARSIRIEITRRLLAIVVLYLAHADPPQAEQPTSEPFRRFTDAVERDFARTRKVESYANALGYSVRSLTRACRSATGCSAKQVIDARVTLEAKRLLVHTELSSAAVGARVGLTDPVAFTRFFRINVGQTPTQFRTRARGS